MGRYLQAGILTRFSIYKRKNWYSDKNFDVEKELENILKDISRIIDPSMYELIEKNEKCYKFGLKPEIFDNNIHELIREISHLTYPNADYFYNEDIDFYSEEFIKEYPFSLKMDENKEYIVETNDEEMIENSIFYPLYWIIKDRRLFENVDVCADVITLWRDIDKYDGEDETKMLKIINNLKTTYYSSPLSKAFIYYVTD